MSEKMPRLIAWLTLGMVLSVVACQSVQTTRSGEVGVDRPQRMSSLVSAKEVDAAAQQQYARERMGRQAATGMGLAVVEVLTGVQLGDIGQMLAQSMFVLPNSRESEQEADRIGVELAARAGYDPRAAVALWNKMQNLGGS